MKNITLDNYEAYFLDYMEGQLNSEQLSELSLFLSLYPELKPQLESSQIKPIQSDNYTFKNKKLLKKLDFQTVPINDRNFDDFCIAYNEQLLTHEKITELITYCNHNPKQNISLELFKKVYLKPQFNLRFPKKKSLYRKVIVHKFISTTIFRIASVAAGIALLITLYYLGSTRITKNQNSQMAIANTKLTILPIPNKTSSTPVIAKDSESALANKRIPNNITIPLANESKRDTPITNSTIRNKEDLYLAQLPSLEIKPIDSKSNRTSIIYKPEIVPEIQNNTQTLSETVGSAIEKFKNEVINLEGFKDKKGNISLMKLVKVGITGINKITESNMALTEKIDSTGNVTAYSFNSEIIKFQKNVRN